MKGQTITMEITFECLYGDGGCKYKNPANRFRCVGCGYGMVVKQTPPIIKPI